MTYPSARPLDDAERELVDLATRAIDENTDAGPDEDGVHTVGAAVMAGDYRMFAGVNLYHFTGGPCAELVALGAARAAGAREVVAIVAVGNHGRGVLAPCGRDRQVLVDYHPGCRVVMPSSHGPVSVLATDLLPGAYRAGVAVPLPEADERPVIELSGRYLADVVSGAKTRTTRRTREASPGPVRLMVTTDPRTWLDAEVTAVRATTLAGLTQEDADAENADSPERLRAGLRGHYPGILDEDEVWVHELRLVGERPRRA